ncbi:hypothetical protein STRIP9103_06437 [Streptomyces ipomoeae 91-03]|uniref:Uncharacterized protein n=1 Tax=Streptomyces ipomoeae 91-03 TaxID=698759 RepID=L1KUM3_9ACTN|nr:hypothetical protein STRIP9103_06437 [Streptomyces ipomoeae 91-03]
MLSRPRRVRPSDRLSIAVELDMPTLVDLGYENVGDGFRHPHKKPVGGELTEAKQTYNKVIGGIHGVCQLPAQDYLQGPAPGQPRPQPHSRSPPQPSSCSSSSTTAPSDQSQNVIIRYWQRLTELFPVTVGHRP